MQRGLTALACAAVLLASLPATVGAAKVLKGTDNDLQFSCSGNVDGGFVNAFAEVSQSGGGFGELDAWFDPAIPFEDPATAFGVTDTVNVGAGDPFTVTESFTLTDPDGVELGSGSLTATISRIGDPVQEPAPGPSNHHSATVVTTQDLEGTGTVNVLGTDYELDCSGAETHWQYFEANPTAYTASNEGVIVDCTWTGEGVEVGFFAQQDLNGFFVSAYQFVEGGDGAFSGTYSGSLSAATLHASTEMNDAITGEAVSTATADASLAATGDPVTAFLTQQNVRNKLVTQAMSTDGELSFSTGESYPMDNDHCRSQSFANHIVVQSPKGPKPGPAPVNDTPDGAIAFKLGSIVNIQTTSTAVYPEVPITTCPEGVLDDFGHTVWYTFNGTGNDVTIDTAGSSMDTVVAAFTRDGDAWTEVGCDDDVPIDAAQPLSLQAALTIPTEAGVTYYVEAGGYRLIFNPDEAQSGRLRLAIN